MPGPLTYAAITLLARDRIGQIKRALQAKKAAGTAKELELHVLHLATQAEVMMNASQPVIEPPVRLYGPPLTEQVSRFTLLGAVGPDLPRYAAYFVPGQRWLFDTLHKGTPDEHRELVLTNSTNLVFDFVKRVVPMIDTEFSGKTGKQLEGKLQMKAYAMGHLCHIAADVLSHPYFEGIESRLAAPAVGTNPAVRFMQRDDVAGAFDVRIADVFFARGTDTRNKKWADWFPTPGDVPKSFAKAMAASIEATYGARAAGLPAFDEAFGKIDPAPPALSTGLIDESIDYFRTIIEIERVWTYPDWLGATAAMFLPMSFAYFGALALPFGKDLSRSLTASDPADAEDRRLYESVVFPLAFSSLGPLVAMIIVSASGRQLRAEGVTGWVQAGLSIVSTVGFFASLGGAGAARWTLWFALPLAFSLFQIIFAAVRGNKENARKLLWLGPVVQIGLAAAFLLLYRAFLHKGVEELDKDSDKRNTFDGIWPFLIWFGIVLGLWFLIAGLFRKYFSASVPEDRNLFAGGEPRQFLRLYDDVGLVHNFGRPTDSDRMADLQYPPGRRALVKFWWEPVGGQVAQVVIAHDRITFTFPGSAVGPRVVFSPLVPITIEKWSALLAAVVTADGAIGKLQVKVAREDEKSIELPTGALFADNGDDQTDLAKHNAAATAAANVGGSEAAAFTLFHTPRPRLAVRMGRSGMARDEVRTARGGEAGSLLRTSLVNPRHLFATLSTAGTSPLLGRLFRPGDVLQIGAPAPVEQRIVEQVLSDTEIIVSSPFNFAIPPIFPGVGGVSYQRLASDRSLNVAGITQIIDPGLVAGALPNEMQSVTNPIRFGSQLKVGDVIEVKTVPPQRRTITAIKDAVVVGGSPVSLIALDGRLAPPSLQPPPAAANTPAPVAYERMSDESADGFPFFADPDDVFGDGGSVMNDAADLGALLCIGAASRFIDSPGLLQADGATAPFHRVSQVFRNWNLDRRRLNEWMMMVGGSASSERRGDFRASDEAAPIDPADAGETFSDEQIATRQSGEGTARELGWLNTFRSWVEVASHPGTDITQDVVFHPGNPSNRDLSRAVAYMLDAAPAATP